MGEMSVSDQMLAVVQGGDHDGVPFVEYDNPGAENKDMLAPIGRGDADLLS